MSAKSCGRIHSSLTVPCTLRVSFPGYSCAPLDVLVPLCQAQVWGERYSITKFFRGARLRLSGPIDWRGWTTEKLAGIGQHPSVGVAL